MNENAKKWVEALRSGKYKQGNSYLHKITNDEELFCCLGVACVLYGEENDDLNVKKVTDRDINIVEYDMASTVLPSKVTSWLGLSYKEGTYYLNGLDYSLPGDNDGGKSFEEIADIIESEPDNLFKQEN